MTDYNGNILNIGDVVRYSHHNEDYTFTIDEFKGNDVWGHNIPNGEAWFGDNNQHKNWHSANSVERVKPRTPWEGNTLKFRFIHD